MVCICNEYIKHRMALSQGLWTGAFLGALVFYHNVRVLYSVRARQVMRKYSDDKI